MQQIPMTEEDESFEWHDVVSLLTNNLIDNTLSAIADSSRNYKTDETYKLGGGRHDGFL